MRKIFSDIRSGVIQGVVSLVILWTWVTLYAAIGSSWTSPSSYEATSSTTLSSTSWNNVLADVANLDARVTTLSGSIGGLWEWQTWQSFMWSRALGTMYTNSTSKPIVVMVTCAVGAYQLTPMINGVAIGMNGNSTWYNNAVSWIVPAGNTYGLNVASGGCTLQYWSELR